MNSTWLSAHNEDRKQRVYDYGYLALGENQIFDAAHFLDERKPDLAIVVLHHPPGWLIEHDRNILFEQLGRRAHFLLHGHEHQQMAQISQGTHSDVMTIPAGACYKRRFEPDPRYVNSFNCVSVDLEAGTGSVFFQKWQEQAGAWRADDVLWPKGRFPFVLPTRSAENSPQQREAIHEVALFYRPFLKKRMLRDFVLHVKQTKHRSRAELVSLHMEYILEVESGGLEDFPLDVGCDDMVRRLAEKDADVHCVEDYKLIVEGTPIKDLKRTDIDVQQSVPLPRDPVKSELEYKQNPPAQGVWTMTLRRFTRAFKLVFVPAGDLEYEFRPLGGFAAPKPAKWKMFDAYVIKRNTLCFPHQGYQVKWRPLE